MKIAKVYNPTEFPRLLQINDECYTGIERPSAFEFEGMLKNTDVFVASEAVDRDPNDWRIIGFAICKPTISPARGPYLWSIAVSVPFQNRGVGGNLLREVIKAYTLSKEKEITLHCKPSNPAQKLYFDYGFRVEVVAPHWFGRNELGLFMRRPLP
jgi:ribosomal protein S18 acetylase RimI-like enzyme